MNLHGKWGQAATAALLTSVAFSGAAWAQAAGTPQKGGTFVLALAQDPPTVNPDITTSVPDQTTGCMIYEALVDNSPAGDTYPSLAKSWTISPDGLTYTFDLVQTEWQDGKPFTSEDVKYTITEVSMKLSSVFASAGRVIDSVEAPALDKVVIKLKQPFGPLLVSLGCEYGAAILPAHLFKGTDVKTNPATSATPVGTGPYKLVEWKRGDSMRMVRNPKYRDQTKPYFDDIVVKVISQTASRLQALHGGEIDGISTFPPASVSQVKADPKLKVVDSTSASQNLLYFNVSKKPFDDKKVRQALFMAIDRDYLMKNAFYEVGSVGTQPFTSAIAWAANTDIDYRKMYPFDVAKANAALDAAGFKRGADGKRFAVRMKIFGNEYPELQQAAIAIKSMWQQVGVDSDIKPLESATYIKEVFQERDFDVTFVGYSAYSDPALGIARAYRKATVGQGYGNPSGYSDPKLEELWEKGERATSPAERGKFYKEAQAILAEDLPALNLRQYFPVNAVQKNVQGIWGATLGNGRYGTGWYAK